MAAILVAPENQPIWEALKPLVESSEHRMCVADSVEEALLPEVTQTFDLIILNVTVVSKALVQAILSLRVSGHEQPIILVTGLADSSAVNYMQLASRIPGVQIVTRPNLLAELQAVIKKATEFAFAT